MALNDHSTILYNKHLLIETDRGILLIDTGSPTSFHDEGCIVINGCEHQVSTSFMGVTTSYIAQKVGCELSGLLGMDIISLYSMRIDVGSYAGAIGEVLFAEPDESKQICGESLMGTPLLEAQVSGQSVRLLFDSGAPIFYIDSRLTCGVPTYDTVMDFSPLMGAGEYELQRHLLPTHFSGIRDEEPVDIAYADMPIEIAMLLGALHVDGIIGFDLIDRYRLVVDRGVLFFPDQGV